MRYGQRLLPGDLPYNALKRDLHTQSPDAFMQTLAAALRQLLPCDSFDTADRNYLGALKLAKKYEKRHRLVLGSQVDALLSGCGAFAGHLRMLRQRYDHQYPQYIDFGTARPQLVAHRAFDPYDTGCAFVFRYPCDYVEVDVCCDAAGAVVLRHDPYEEDGAPLAVVAAAGPVASLDAMLARFDARAGPRLMVDMKGSEASHALVDGVVAALRAHGVPPQRVLLASFNERFLRWLARHHPEYPRGLISASTSLDDHAHMLSLTDASVLIVDENTVCERLAASCHAALRQLWVYTVNQPRRLRHIASMGVDAVITDHPNLMRPAP